MIVANLNVGHFQAFQLDVVRRWPNVPTETRDYLVIDGDGAHLTERHVELVSYKRQARTVHLPTYLNLWLTQVPDLRSIVFDFELGLLPGDEGASGALELPKWPANRHDTGATWLLPDGKTLPIAIHMWPFRGPLGLRRLTFSRVDSPAAILLDMKITPCRYKKSLVGRVWPATFTNSFFDKNGVQHTVNGSMKAIFKPYAENLKRVGSRAQFLEYLRVRRP